MSNKWCLDCGIEDVDLYGHPEYPAGDDQLCGACLICVLEERAEAALYELNEASEITEIDSSVLDMYNYETLNP